MNMDRRALDVLLIEDNPGDVRLIREGLKDSRIISRINVVEDGEEAMEYLRCSGRYAGVSHPDIILLDLNLPKKDGREILAEIKQDPELRRIPVVVLTSSKAEQDIIRAYELHANCYLTKPLDLSEFTVMIQSFEQFWLSRVTLPITKN
jgi:chemotaxis family two-component system response regulator Rcp1